MKFFNSLKLKSKLIIAFGVFGILPAIVMAWIAWTNAQNSLLNAAEKQLMAKRDGSAHAVSTLLETMRGQVLTTADSVMTQDAMRAFSEGYENYLQEFEGKPSKEAAISSLTNYYQSQFGNEYKNQNGGADVSGIEKKISSLSPNGMALQYSYISNNPNPLGSKQLLKAANDGTSWSQAHLKYHNGFKSFYENFGIYDVFLVEPKDGVIVYSVFKELDFATSLVNGPYANSGIGEAYKKAASGTAGQSYMTDLAKYRPSYEAPASFISSRIEEDGKLLGVLIFQVPVAQIEAIMTSQGKWKESGFGQSGEVYLVGQDRRMRSQGRELVEKYDEYMASATTLQSKEDLEYMEHKKTTVLAAVIDIEPVEAALSGKRGFMKTTSQTGESILSAYAPVKIGDVEWAVVSEVRTDEALDSVALSRIIGLVIILSVVAVLLFSWIFSKTLSAKLANAVDSLLNSANDSLQKSQLLKDGSQKVASATTEQASAIQETVATLDQITAMVNKSVEYANKSSERANESHSVASKGKKVVEEMRNAMTEIDSSNASIMQAINESNAKISKIVDVINEIASKTNVINDIVFQTKLLSFNASVEAARAGEHGKGFAVVAEEVGNLAQMSGTAAQEIEEMLGRSVKEVETVITETNQSIGQLVEAGKAKVESGVAIAARCEEVLDEVVHNVGEVTSMMQEVAHGSKEQAQGVSNISTAMNQLDETTHSNSEVAQETSEHSESLSESARGLMGIVSLLGQEVYGNSYNHLEAPTLQEVSHKDTSRKVVPLKQPKKPSAPQSVTSEPKLKAAAGSHLPTADDDRFEDI